MIFAINKNVRESLIEPMILLSLEERHDNVKIIGTDKKTGLSRLLGYFREGSLVLVRGVESLVDLKVDSKGYMDIKYF